MTGFADPDVMRRRASKARTPGVTIEVGHAESRTGILVHVPDLRSARTARYLLESTFDVAGRYGAGPHVNDPGWWAAMICHTAFSGNLQASIQRTPARAAVNVALVVDRGRGMVEGWPDWPMVRLSGSGRLLDLRGETALAHGPSDAELRAYGVRLDGDVVLADLRRAWDVGALEWCPGPVLYGKRGIRAAGA